MSALEVLGLSMRTTSAPKSARSMPALMVRLEGLPAKGTGARPASSIVNLVDVMATNNF